MSTKIWKDTCESQKPYLSFCRLSFLSHLSHLSKNNALIKIFVSDVFQKKKNEHFSKIFRPISDLFRPLLKHPETKGFDTFRAKFSDLKMVGRNSRFFLQNALSFCIFAVRELAAYNRRLTVRKETSRKQQTDSRKPRLTTHFPIPSTGGESI